MTDIRSFLGFTNYYRKVIHRHAQVARPWNKLISGGNASKKKVVEWNSECHEAFLKLKDLCSDTPVLYLVMLITQSLLNYTLMLQRWVWGLCCIMCRRMVLRE